GIGEQPRGETLRTFGEPIVRWLNRWSALQFGDIERSIELVQAELRPSSDTHDRPAYAVLDVSTKDAQGKQAHQTWLMAESWWAGDVQRRLSERLRAGCSSWGRGPSCRTSPSGAVSRE